MKVRIRFDDTYAKWYLESRERFLFFPYWSLVRKKGEYSHSTPAIRRFTSYKEAFDFSIKMATDVVVEHKHNEYTPKL